MIQTNTISLIVDFEDVIRTAGKRIMANYPTQNKITIWVSSATDIFQSIMPPISNPYPCAYIATEKTFPSMRAQLMSQTGCKHTEESEAAIMIYSRR